MRAAGVPVVPGCDLVENVEQLRVEAEKIGYPLLIKARSGGGGRGIRRVDGPEELERAFLSATAEAQSAFGDGAVYMEKLLENVKHVEVQVLCDSHGNVVTLGERECSMQRKHQKLIEESPSPAVDGALRIKMLDAAARAARAVGYEGVGTVEFLLTKNKEFYFMEMNTRLQVEHPVTELVTGIDLVKWQIRVAAAWSFPSGRTTYRFPATPSNAASTRKTPPRTSAPAPARSRFCMCRAGRGCGLIRRCIRTIPFRRSTIP